MKLVLIALATLVSLSANADIPMPKMKIQRYQPVLATIHPDHVARPGQTTFEINETTNTVKMQINREWYCPPNAVCAMVMPAPLIVELPVVAVKEKGCGIREFTALEDKRPVDGALRLIKIEDDSQSKCAYVRAPELKALYLTKFYPRMEGKEVTIKSTFKLKRANSSEPEVRSYDLTGGEVLKYGGNVQISGGNIKISDTKVQLSVDLEPKCLSNRPCPMWMPPPVQAELEIVEVRKTGCGDDIVARSFTDHGVQEMVIKDYSFALCEIVITNVIQATYTEKTVGVNDRQQISRQFKLTFN